MYALCVYGAVNTQGFVWRIFLCDIYIIYGQSIAYFRSDRSYLARPIQAPSWGVGPSLFDFLVNSFRGLIKE